MQLVDTYKKEHQDKYLKPIWNTNTIYDETGVVIGEEGEMKLLFTPKKETLIVRDIHLGRTYQAGKDFLIATQGIKRIKGGDLPFFAVDEYFTKEKVFPILLELDPEKENLIFDEKRYIFFSEGAEGVRNYLAVSYQVDEKWQGFIPMQDEKAKRFVDLLRKNRKAKFFFTVIRLRWAVMLRAQSMVVC